MNRPLEDSLFRRLMLLLLLLLFSNSEPSSCGWSDGPRFPPHDVRIDRRLGIRDSLEAGLQERKAQCEVLASLRGDLEEGNGAAERRRGDADGAFRRVFLGDWLAGEEDGGLPVWRRRGLEPDGRFRDLRCVIPVAAEEGIGRYGSGHGGEGNVTTESVGHAAKDCSPTNVEHFF